MARRRHQRWWFWLETIGASVATATFVFALFWPRWLESLFEADVDGGGGSAELAIAVVALLIAIASSLAARRQWVRTRADRTAPSRAA